MQTVCDELRREREKDIRHKSCHALQMQNELSAYNNSQSDISQMLKKSLGYTHSAPYKRLLSDVEKMLSNDGNGNANGNGYNNDNKDNLEQHYQS